MALRDDAGDVRRLFDLLVQTLADAGAERLYGPIQISEIYQTVLPYRRFRTALGMDTNQDYEGALLRLLAGEGGYLTLHPPEAQEALAAELEAVHPDPGLIREFAGATIRIDRARLERVLSDERRYAPPEATAAANPQDVVQRVRHDLELGLPAAPVPVEPRPVAPVDAPVCRNCGRSLPLNREVVFCPLCGSLAGARSCITCGDALEEGWRFCARCGAPAPHPSRRPSGGP